MPDINTLNKPVAIIFDGMNLLFRFYYGMPKSFRWANGVEYQGAYGAMASILRCANDNQAAYVCVCIDSQQQSDRATMWAGYKATREATLEARGESPISQLKIFQEALEAAKIASIEMPGFEADDCIAAVSKCLLKVANTVVIVSADQDLQQLLGLDPRIMIMPSGKSEKSITHDSFVSKYGILPTQLPDLKALAGDMSDEIPGLPGIGLKRAAALLGTYGSIESLIAKSSLLPERLQMVVKQNADLMKVWKQICTLRSEAAVSMNPDTYAIDRTLWTPVREYFKK